MRRSLARLAPAAFALLLLRTEVTLAGDPELGRIEPRGAARGEALAITFHGKRLHDATAIHADGPGLVFGAVEVVDATEVRVQVSVAADCALGEHLLRVVTRSGVSAVASLWIGPFPSVEEVEPNDDPTAAPALDLAQGPRTVAGNLTPGDCDHFAIDVAEGARLAVEIEAMRLGLAMFDPRLELLDEDLSPLLRVDDTPLLGADAWLTWHAPRTMRVVLRVRDAAWRGGGLYLYRLHVGDFPRPSAIFPPGGRPREATTLRFLGAEASDDHERTLELPASGSFPFGLHLEVDGVSSPSWTPFRLTGHVPVLEVEPNDRPADATAAPPAAAAFHGILDRPGDVDWFALPVKAGTELRVNAMGRFLGSPVDTVLTVADDAGNVLVEVDDAGGPDARIERGVDADGTWRIGVRDLRGRSARDFVYRVEVTEIRPGLTLTIPRFGRDSQARQALAVPRGGRVATAVRVSRNRFEGAVTFEPRGLPPSVTLVAPEIGEDDVTGILVFAAAPDAPLGARSVDLLGRRPKTDEAPAVTGRFTTSPELVTFGPNFSVFHRARLDRLTIAVVEAAPFTLDLDAPRTALCRGGFVDLTVRVTREEGFAGPITVRPLGLPPGTSAPSTLRVEPDAKTATLRIDAKGDARVGEGHLVLLGEADRGGTVFQASSPVSLRVEEPVLLGSLALAAIPRGGPGLAVCRISGARPFEGTVVARLSNLPSGVTAAEQRVAPGQGEIAFPLQASPDARLGLARNLFVEFALDTVAGPVRWRTAHGGQLRVDPPAPVAAAPPEDATVPRRSRLEQLRAEAKQRAEERRAAVAGESSRSGADAGGGGSR